MRFIHLVLLSCLLASPAIAQSGGGRDDFTCSSQLRASVSSGMPAGLRDLDTNALSCLGLTQVYLILNGPGNDRDYEAQQRIRAVFRREGLAR